VPHGTVQVFIIILYENVFQNPELFPTQISISPKQSILGINVNASAVLGKQALMLMPENQLCLHHIQNQTIRSKNGTLQSMKNYLGHKL
jgi:hypothetical protein